jgi:ribosome recycling factor
MSPLGAAFVGVSAAAPPTLRDGAWVHAHRPVAPAVARPRRGARAPTMVDAEAAAAAVTPDAEARMRKTIEATNGSFNTVRTGRASTAILDRITVDYYGAETPLNQLAAVSVSGSSTIVVDAYDKSAIKDIERALMESDVGITPSNDGSVIRLAVPPLTQDRRKELAKQVKGLAEEGRVAIRNIRRDAVEKCKKMEKAKDIGQDESKTIQAAVQKATDRFIKDLDALLKAKEGDIMKV